MNPDPPRPGAADRVPIYIDLFLASCRSNRPLPEVYRSVIPMPRVLLSGVLLITYVPFLTTFLPRPPGRWAARPAGAAMQVASPPISALPAS